MPCYSLHANVDGCKDGVIIGSRESEDSALRNLSEYVGFSLKSRIMQH